MRRWARLMTSASCCSSAPAARRPDPPRVPDRRLRRGGERSGAVRGSRPPRGRRRGRGGVPTSTSTHPAAGSTPPSGSPTRCARSPVPVYAFVNPRAYSAGALIALSAATHLHAAGRRARRCHAGGRQGVKASEKMVSAMRAEFRALAEARGLDPRIAEAMVDETRRDPRRRSRRASCSPSAPARRSASGSPRPRADEARRCCGRSASRARASSSVEPNWAELVVRFLTNPLVSPLLLSLGILGLVFEIKTGAFGLGGLVSLASLGLFFGSSFLLGLAGWEEVLLLGLGAHRARHRGRSCCRGSAWPACSGWWRSRAAVVLAMIGSVADRRRTCSRRSPCSAPAW